MIGHVCMSTASCKYKSEISGYCGYTGNGCVNEHVQSVWINEPSYKIIQQVDVSDESIEKIADAVIKKLEEREENEHKYFLDPNLTQRKLF